MLQLNSQKIWQSDINMFNLLTLGSVLLSYCSGECFYEKVLGAHLRPKNKIFDKLDIQTRMLDVLDQ